MRVGLQLRAEHPDDAVAAARRAEELGYDIVLVADHVGSDLSPLLTLAAVAAGTERIRIGTYVLNAALHHPLLLARDIVTLDQQSGGRVQLGLGAGHAATEFAACGVPFPAARERKRRLAAFVEVVRRLLDGETVDHHGDGMELSGAAVGRSTVQARVPILVGGSGHGLLTHAAHHADIVGLTGLGRTLPDGHRHTVRFGPGVVDAEVEMVRQAAAGRPVEIDVLVQVVDVTDDREAAANSLAGEIEDLSVEDALATPYLALGTVEEIGDHFRRAHERWGLDSIVVRDAEAFAPVLPLLPH